MDGRIYLPANIILPNSIHLSDEEKKQTLVIERDSKNIVELEYLPALHFKDFTKEEILEQITRVTESKVTGWTHEGQKYYLNSAIQSLKIENEIIKKTFDDKNLKADILDLMLFGKYILQFRKNGSNHDGELNYVNQFKARLLALIEKVVDIKQLIHSFAESDNFLRILPLAYQEIIKNDEALSEFRASELVGHNAAYAVAKEENRYKRIIVINNAKEIVENYEIQEIRVMKNNQRDLGLKGLIVIPNDHKQDAVVTVYVTWAGTHSIASRNADLERAPGEESYRCGEDQILRFIIDSILKLKKPVKLVFCGHSLGGSLAQLCFHSFQRIIALSFKNEELHAKIVSYEDKLGRDLFKFSPHQRDLSEFRINPGIIHEMSVDVWNSAGVLQPIIQHSNELSPILVAHGIQQLGNFGLVGGDVVQSFGHGYILNNVTENQARIKILKVIPLAAISQLATYSLPLALPAGVGVFGSNAIGWAAGILCLGAIFAKVISDKTYAHRKHHFKKGSRPEDAYIIYKSHQSDGALNAEHCRIIQEELSSKSSALIETGVHYISDNYMQDERFKSEFNKVLDVCKLPKPQNTEIQTDPMLAFLFARIKNFNDDERIIKLIKENKISAWIKAVDVSGKSLLYYALENGNFAVASALLDDDQVDVNYLDSNRNFALLIYMQYIHNSYIPISQSVYKLGLKILEKTTADLRLPNNKNQSVEQLYKKWYWSGFSAKPFMIQLAKHLEATKNIKSDEIKLEIARL